MSGILQQQVGGDHYKKLRMQPVELIAKLQLNYFLGNVLKYVTRHRDKNGKEDLEKALHYLKFAEKYKLPVSALGMRYGHLVMREAIANYARVNMLSPLELDTICFASAGEYDEAKKCLKKLIKNYTDEL